MAQFLTPDQINLIKRIIEKRHSAIILRLLGVNALTAEERALLISSGISIENQESAIRDIYLYGQLSTKLAPDRALKTSYKQFKEEIEESPVELSEVEQNAVQAAELHAGANIRHLGAKVEQQTSQLIFQEDQALRNRLVKEVANEVKVNIEKRASIGTLKKKLAAVQNDWERDWNRVAITEKANALLRGQADALRKTDGDPEVFKRPQKNCCPYCRKFYIGPDGHPRIFKLSSLEANGTNVGLKAAQWKAVLSTIHPGCLCVLSRVPPGWGFNANSDLVPGGKFGVREGDVQKSLTLEIAAVTSQMGDRNISQSNSGVALVFKMPKNVAGSETTKEQMKDIKSFVANFGTQDRERLVVKKDMKDLVLSLDQPSEPVHTLEPPDMKKEIDKEVLAAAPANKKRLKKKLKANLDMVKNDPYPEG